ncbi:MAG: LysR family transcriptional regulator, partial [Bdellovibrionales bacterium]|nr:LysR family transcriptional regulator [Bdellovibrionales bacterium]
SKSDLEYFMEIARSGHMSRASERLGVTQPSLSHCIKKVESEIGLELFIRSKKGMRLTAAGQRLFEEAEILSANWDRVLRAARDEIERPQGVIRLGCHTAVAQYTLPHIMPPLVKNYPEITIHLQHGLSRHLTEDVISSKIDMAIVVNPVRHNDLVIKELCSDIVTLWTPNKCMNPHLLILAPELTQTQEVLKKLGKKEMFFSNHMESSSLEVIAHLLKSGIGHAILPQRVVHSVDGGERHVSMVKNAPVVKDKICLIYKPEVKKILRAEIFIHLVAKHIT